MYTILCSFIPCFNPHSHAGSDSTFLHCSILALSFNPHSHAGSDFVIPAKIEAFCEVSIHTPTRGVTALRRTIGSHGKCFNPHSHAGSDLHQVLIFFPYKVSIHTPTRGVTSFDCDDIDYNRVSIHTPTRGVTSWTDGPTVAEVFQSTLPRGE